jgi:hemolysin III
MNIPDNHGQPRTSRRVSPVCHNGQSAEKHKHTNTHTKKSNNKKKMSLVASTVMNREGDDDLEGGGGVGQSLLHLGGQQSRNSGGIHGVNSSAGQRRPSNPEIWFHSEFLAESAENTFIQKKADDRLFPDHLLYCEGMPKPTFRGFLHLICTVLLPFGLVHLFLESNSVFLGQFGVSVYWFGQFFCCCVSALYHIGKFNPATEIVLQKLDHCGIAICTTCINFPVCLLLLPWPEGLVFLFLSVSTCLWVVWNVLVQRRPGVWRLVLTASVIVPFLPLLYSHMTIYEFLCVLGNCFFQSLGVAVFANRSPDPFPRVFGYHEVFHVFTVCGFLSVYLCNWSVVRRTCNPYLVERDIFEDLFLKRFFQ